jgi:protein disulfide-isomerase
MKKLLLTLSVAIALTSVHAADATWQTDLPKAQAQAAKEKKMVLLDFTGSDWCGWCIKLHKEVFWWRLIFPSARS